MVMGLIELQNSWAPKANKQYRWRLRSGESRPSYCSPALNVGFRLIIIVSAGVSASFTGRNMPMVRAVGREHTVVSKVHPGFGNQGRQAGDEMLNRCGIKSALFTLTAADYNNVPMSV